MKMKFTATALLLAAPVFAAPFESNQADAPTKLISPPRTDGSAEASEAEDFSDLARTPPLGDHSFEVDVLTPPAHPPSYVRTCLQYNAMARPGRQVFAQRIFGHPPHVPCNSSEANKFTRETILAAGWVRLWHTKLLVPVAEFVRNGSALVLARGNTTLDDFGGAATLAVEPVGGSWTHTPGGVATAGTPRQTFTFEMEARNCDEREPAHYGTPLYDVREGETGGCLQVAKHSDGFESQHRDGHAVEELTAFVRPCQRKEFSWTWTEIPKEVYASVMAPPRW